MHHTLEASIIRWLVRGRQVLNELQFDPDKKLPAIAVDSDATADLKESVAE